MSPLRRLRKLAAWSLVSWLVVGFLLGLFGILAWGMTESQAVFFGGAIAFAGTFTMFVVGVGILAGLDLARDARNAWRRRHQH
jgi:H+/Cl- antiporter ClcA